ncbi:MAG: Hpt domain-containing protein [Leptospiraceae bacterium]|nr:Hpt domain-containing protein [Leptospiraceae bacterium]MCP5494076.1 Hpt domain-containing protein [Leptospiraceae bacterium]
MEEISNIMDYEKYKEFQVISKGTDDLLIKLLDKYEETSMVYIQSIKGALLKRDINGLLGEIHSLKGATATLALNEIYKMIFKLEEEVKGNRTDNVEKVMDIVEKKLVEVNLFKEFLKNK